MKAGKSPNSDIMGKNLRTALGPQSWSNLQGLMFFALPLITPSKPLIYLASYHSPLLFSIKLYYHKKRLSHRVEVNIKISSLNGRGKHTG